ncbi:MaoC family dehydratase [Streptomyces sp. NPDC047000]|uniref:MaoC family dehydratase n=1 Tax=Streptomyces sp. NPDC047000 TaxID=3155474 RepID=UPI003410AD34
MALNVYDVDALAGLSDQDLGHTAWREITQERVNTFADATDDHQWIHVDAERARTSPFRGTIAHGYLTVSLLVPLFLELVEVKGAKMAVNYGLNKVRFPAPVKVGARVRLLGRVVEAEEIKGGGVQILLDFTVEAEGSAKPACVAEAVYRFYR